MNENLVAVGHKASSLVVKMRASPVLCLGQSKFFSWWPISAMLSSPFNRLSGALRQGWGSSAGCSTLPHIWWKGQGGKADFGAADEHCQQGAAKVDGSVGRAVLRAHLGLSLSHLTALSPWCIKAGSEPPSCSWVNACAR